MPHPATVGVPALLPPEWLGDGSLQPRCLYAAANICVFFVNQPFFTSGWGGFCSFMQSLLQRGWVHSRAGLGRGMLSHGEGQSTPWHPIAPLGTSSGWLETSSRLSGHQLQRGLRMGPGDTGMTAGWPRSLGRAAIDCHGNTPHLVLELRVVLSSLSSLRFGCGCAHRGGPRCVPVSPQRRQRGARRWVPGRGMQAAWPPPALKDTKGRGFWGALGSATSGAE